MGVFKRQNRLGMKPAFETSQFQVKTKRALVTQPRIYNFGLYFINLLSFVLHNGPTHCPLTQVSLHR